MAIAITGLNHHSGGMKILALACLPARQLPEGLLSLRRAIPKTAEALVLTTCNRCELYVSGVPVEKAVRWFSEYRGIPTAIFERYAYLHKEEAALRHLIEVACGLNSMLIGETQIQGQVKTALYNARESGCTRTQLSRLFEHALAAAKRVRHETEIGKHSVSFPALVVKLSKHLFADLSQKRVLLIGTGEVAQTAMKHLQKQQLGSYTIAGHSPERTARVAAQFGAEALTIAGLPEVLHDFDIIVSATASEACILELESVKKAMKKRRHRVMLMADLAVPYDIDPRVGELDDVFLYDLEHLANVARKNRAVRTEAGLEAQEIITQEVAKYFAWTRAQKLGELLATYQTSTATKREELKSTAMAMIQEGKTPEKVVDYVCTALSGALSHQTITLLKSLIELNIPLSPEAEKKIFSPEPRK